MLFGPAPTCRHAIAVERSSQPHTNGRSLLSDCCISPLTPFSSLSVPSIQSGLDSLLSARGCQILIGNTANRALQLVKHSRYQISSQMYSWNTPGSQVGQAQAILHANHCLHGSHGSLASSFPCDFTHAGLRPLLGALRASESSSLEERSASLTLSALTSRSKESATS